MVMTNTKAMVMMKIKMNMVKTNTKAMVMMKIKMNMKAMDMKAMIMEYMTLISGLTLQESH